MLFAVTLRWNNQIVLTGTMTAVLTHTVLKHLMVDNFTISEIATACRESDFDISLETITKFEVAQQSYGKVHGDDSASASFLIERLS